MFNALGIPVEDMGRSLAFYRRLGLDIPGGADSEPHVGHTLPGGFTLMWDTHEVIRSFDPTFTPPRKGEGGMGLAFQCGGPSEVDKLHTELVEAGYESHLDPFDAAWGQRYAVVYDPDGNTVDLYAPLETAHP